MVLALLTGCKDEEDAVVREVTTDLAFSVSESSEESTRMSAAVVQEDGNYRYIQDVHIVPFLVTGRKIQAKDQPQWERTTGVELDYERTNEWFYYYQHCRFVPGVASFLVYGRAVPTYGATVPTIADYATNGSLDAVFPAGMQPRDISFTPTVIYGTHTAHSKAVALANYLTAIANTSVTLEGTTTTWAQVTNSGLKALYQNFIGQKNVTTADLAGASINVRVYVNELYSQVEGLTGYAAGSVEAAMRQAILNQIANYAGVTFDDTEQEVTSLGTSMENFPASIGLPDGAAVVRWTGTRFEPQTQTTTMDNITGIARYAYPAELYYYANSLIRTSVVDDRKESYTGSTQRDTWEEVLADYEFDPGVVSRRTTAVAIKDPLQYGVGHLQISLKKVETASLPDAAGTNIPVETVLPAKSHFPLTAIIVGNQHPVGFDFKPNGTEDYFLYDSQVQQSNGTNICLSTTVEQSAATHTLVLESNDDEEVALVLEFRNDSGQPFEGVDGLIYPGTKFYLVAKVKPADAAGEGTEDYRKRVFTQDRVTTMNMKVESLAKAYNVLPNLLSPRLEIGVAVLTQWMQAETTNVLLD